MDAGHVAEWDVKVTVGEKTYRCVRYFFKKTASNPVTSFECQSWLSLEVPGHLVKSECKYGGGGHQTEELVGFEAKRGK
ncbi:hypothetical protein D3C83_192510 [compost metagenome]